MCMGDQSRNMGNLAPFERAIADLLHFAERSFIKCGPT
jgi:hypothetical protein